MAAEVSAENEFESEFRAQDDVDREAVAEELQRVYEYVLNDRRPEAVGATEQLAEKLGMSVTRPAQSSNQ